LATRLSRSVTDEALEVQSQRPGHPSNRIIRDSVITAYSGRLGGRKTAERGPDYFRQIAAMRQNRKGGRPRKENGGS